MPDFRTLGNQIAALAVALMFVGCSTTRSSAPSQAGAREWSSRFGIGRLELREDWTFNLSLRGEDGNEPWQLRGTWSQVPGDLSQVTLLVRDIRPLNDTASGWLGTEIIAILGAGSAMHLPVVDGVVEVYGGM